MSLPILPVTRPSASACDHNGQLLSTRLAVIGVAGRLEVTAARAWGALYVAMAAAGFTGPDALTYTYGGTYRPLADQVSLFHRRWEPAPLAPITFDFTQAEAWHRANGHVFYMGTWWSLKAGVARAAVPGTSNHGWGLAVDVALGSGPAEARSIATRPQNTKVGPTGLQWLTATAPGPYSASCNAVSFGWSWESQAEPWHLRYIAGDKLPPRVLAVEQYLVALRELGAK